MAVAEEVWGDERGEHRRCCGVGVAGESVVDGVLGDEGFASPLGEVAGEPGFGVAAEGSDGGGLEGLIDCDGGVDGGIEVDDGLSGAEAGPVGVEGCVADVDAVAEDAKGKAVGRGGTGGVELAIVPDGDLLVVPADLDACVGGGGEGVVDAGGGVYGGGLVGVDDLGEAVVELLRLGGCVVEGGGVVCGGSEREEDGGEEGSLCGEWRNAGGEDA